jgi:hypothetical protein
MRKLLPFSFLGAESLTVFETSLTCQLLTLNRMEMLRRAQNRRRRKKSPSRRRQSLKVRCFYTIHSLIISFPVSLFSRHGLREVNPLLLAPSNPLFVTQAASQRIDYVIFSFSKWFRVGKHFENQKSCIVRCMSEDLSAALRH